VFYSCSSLTSLIIPNGVINIGDDEFSQCYNLTNVIIPNSVTSIGPRAFEDCYLLSNITIPNRVTSIGYIAFLYCTSLNNVTFGSGVTNIADSAFFYCTNLTGVYFQGNSPTPTNDTTVFTSDTKATVYYLQSATGWGQTFDGLPTMMWNPQAMTRDNSFGVKTNGFGFNIIGSSNLTIVVEASTNLVNSAWSPVSTNTLNTFIGTNGTAYFSDPQWTNYPGRFYRFRSP